MLYVGHVYCVQADTKATRATKIKTFFILMDLIIDKIINLFHTHKYRGTILNGLSPDSLTDKQITAPHVTIVHPAKYLKATILVNPA